MMTSNFDPCLLITNDDNPEFEFGISRMQTDDTSIVASPALSKEKKNLKRLIFTIRENKYLHLVNLYILIDAL